MVTITVPSMDEVCKTSIANWEKLPPEDRRKCLDHLRTVMEKANASDLLREWADQRRAGIRIGSHDSIFHFGTGMSVRNVLREVIRDDNLPKVEQPGGDMAANWDDYYYGALDQLALEAS